jgi:hypothetical protein
MRLSCLLFLCCKLYVRVQIIIRAIPYMMFDCFNILARDTPVRDEYLSLVVYFEIGDLVS